MNNVQDNSSTQILLYFKWIAAHVLKAKSAGLWRGSRYCTVNEH